jgi:hypothetical protein
MPPKVPFEDYIKALLKTSASADALRDLATKNIPLHEHKLLKAVDAMLIEQALAAQFNHEGYDTTSKMNQVLDKMLLLKEKIRDKNSDEYVIVTICEQYVSNGYSLTQDIVDTLNTFWKKHE